MQIGEMSAEALLVKSQFVVLNFSHDYYEEAEDENFINIQFKLKAQMLYWRNKLIVNEEPSDSLKWNDCASSLSNFIKKTKGILIVAFPALSRIFTRLSFDFIEGCSDVHFNVKIPSVLSLNKSPLNLLYKTNIKLLDFKRKLILPSFKASNTQTIIDKIDLFVLRLFESSDDISMYIKNWKGSNK